MRDLRHTNTFESGKFYSIFRNSSVLHHKETFSIADMTSTEHSIVETVGKLYEVQTELAKLTATAPNF
jgi:hypothetical protein